MCQGNVGVFLSISVFSMFLLTLYVVVFLKLISYSMVQYWCRNGYPTEETSALTNGSANYTGSTSADEGLKMKEFPKQRKINPRKRTKTFAALGKIICYFGIISDLL